MNTLERQRQPSTPDGVLGVLHLSAIEAVRGSAHSMTTRYRHGRRLLFSGISTDVSGKTQGLPGELQVQLVQLVQLQCLKVLLSQPESEISPLRGLWLDRLKTAMYSKWQQARRSCCALIAHTVRGIGVPGCSKSITTMRPPGGRRDARTRINTG